MAQYDPQALAAYLRQARHPDAGFTPTFTDQDQADPYDFDVRSAEEVGLGAHIDPLTGLPMGAEDPTAIINPISDAIDNIPSAETYSTSQDALKAIRDMETLEDQLVKQKQQEVWDALGVTAARENYQSLVTANANSMFVPEAQRNLALKMEAANLTFGVGKGNLLIGADAAQFDPFEQKFQELEARAAFLKEKEDIDASTKFQVAGEKRKDQTQKSKNYGALGFSEAQEAKITEKLGEQTAQDVASWADNPARLDFMQRVATDTDLGTADEWATRAPELLDTFVKLKAKGVSEEETAKLKDAAKVYKDAGIEANKISERELFSEQEWRELPANKEIRANAIRGKRELKRSELVDKEVQAFKYDLLTLGNMSLDSNANASEPQKLAANAISSLMREEFGITNLEAIVTQAETDKLFNPLRKIRMQYQNTLAGEQGVPFDGVFDLMIMQLVDTINTKGKDRGIIIAPKDNPTITALQLMKMISRNR